MTAKMPADYVDPRDLGPASPLADLPRVFLQEQLDKGRSAPTLTKYERYLAEFVEFVERSTPRPKVRDVDLRTLKAYSSYLTRRQRRHGFGAGRQPVAAVTKNLHLIALRGMLKLAVLLDLPVPGPEKVELMKAPQPSPDARHLEAAKLQRLLEAADLRTSDGVRARALLELFCATGCRVSEVVGLDRAQLELDRHAATPKDGIRIADEVTVLGKGNRHRRVYLTPRAREWVTVYLRTRRDTDPALFITRRAKADGSYRMGVWSAERIVAQCATRAGLAEGVSPHWLRHAAITLWATEMGLPAAQRLAGHKHISSTNRYLGGSEAELKALFKSKIG